MRAQTLFDAQVQRDTLLHVVEYNADQQWLEKTWGDKYEVWINWQTARALERAGLVRLANFDSEFGHDVILTSAGQAEGR